MLHKGLWSGHGCKSKSGRLTVCFEPVPVGGQFMRVCTYTDIHTDSFVLCQCVYIYNIVQYNRIQCNIDMGVYTSEMYASASWGL